MQIFNPANNEDGYVLIVSLIIMMVLVVLGIAATNTTNVELQIAGNEKVAKDNFYKAEAAAYEAAQLLENENAENLRNRDLGGGGTSNDGLVKEDELF